ncbi:MAG: pyridoxal-phosphate dependent enzyme, partial [Proteobacteria bacterium]|nr:pyridoxal-phosphate dependent enzyme [Pseudomonadota bacterium]
LLELTQLHTGPCRLCVKLGNQNPGGSIKDRIGLSMIEAAERDGRIKPGGLLIEATAGNTGLGLALVAGQKGYRLKIIVPDKMSQEKIFHLKAMGAEVVMTRSDVAKGHPEYYQDIAERLEKETENSFWINQFANPANAQAHEDGTGPEIWEQMNHDVDAVVCGVGSGGTLTGLGRFFKRAAPQVEMVLADPEGSILADLVNTGKTGELGSWLIEGIGEDFVPPICDLSLVSQAITISDAESFETARELLSLEGVLGGSSSGTLVAAALRYCRAQSSAKRVVTLIPDSGNKYLSKMFNEYWMMDQGFVEREPTGDVRELIARRAEDDGVISVSTEDTVLIAYGRMRLYEVSQLPVLDGTHIKGIIDESDLLLAVFHHEENFSTPVGEFMTSRLEVIPPSHPIDELLPIFRADRVALVVDGGEFLGMVTKVDLINHLRQKVL